MQVRRGLKRYETKVNNNDESKTSVQRPTVTRLISYLLTSLEAPKTDARRAAKGLFSNSLTVRELTSARPCSQCHSAYEWLRVGIILLEKHLNAKDLSLLQLAELLHERLAKEAFSTR